ncbi:hypothetical protein [Salinithrix halophila]|uniref:Uncharacterized protein n=1 Tax=Salinithrix halophila TaxID=1485204 RepID=A0ABV8JHR0_9BACL
MKAICVSDQQGRILSVNLLKEMGKEPSGMAGAGILPDDDQKVSHIDLPPDLEKRSLLDIQQEFRVEFRGESAHLVKAENFTEPFREKK